MANTLNKIHYCVDINTGYDDSNPNLGLENGHIRYVSDNITIDNTYTYEDGTPVDGTWYKDIVDKNGFSSLGSKIDIVVGGDYAFLQSFNLTLINHTAVGLPYHKVLENQGMYMVGSPVSVYVIIDKVLYPRWDGVIGGLKFDENKFVYQCNDSHANKNNTIKNTVFGKVRRLKLNEVVEQNKDDDIRPVLQVPVTRLKPPAKAYLAEHIGFIECNIAGAETYWDWTRMKSTLQGSWAANPTRDFSNKKIWLDTQRHIVMIQNNVNIDFDLVHYLTFSKGTDEGEPYNIIDWYEDRAGGLIKFLIEGDTPLEDDDDQFGNWENNTDGTVVTALKTFNGSLINFYNTGVKLNSSLDVNKVVKIYDPNGVEVSKDLIFEFFGDYYLPETIVSKTKYDIPHNKISFTYGNTGGYNGMTLSDFNNSYQGEFKPSRLLKHIKVMLNLTATDFSVSQYDKVVLGYNYIKSVKDFTFPARAECDSCWLGINHGGAGSGTIIKPNGQIVPVTNSNVTAVDFANQLAGVCMVDIIPTYEDGKYGIVPVGTNRYKTSIPVPFSVTSKANTAWNHNDGWYKIHNAGATNLPMDLYTIDNVRPRLLSGGGIPAWRDVGGEYNFFEKKYLSENETIPNIKDDLDKSKYIMLVITSNTKNAVEYYMNSNGNTFERTMGGDATVVSPDIQMDFSLIGYTETLTRDGFYAGYDDKDTDTVGEILSVLSDNDTQELKDIRPTYYSGRFIEKQVSKFDLITEICKQSFIGGFTDRKGNTVFKRIMETSSAPHYHNDSKIIDKSLKSFQYTPISKVYNEFEVKYCYEDNKPQKTLEVHNVTRDEFPGEFGEFKPIDINGLGAISGHIWTDSNMGIPILGVSDGTPNFDSMVYRPPVDTRMKITFDDGSYAEGIYWKFASSYAMFKVTNTDLPNLAFRNTTMDKMIFSLQYDSSETVELIDYQPYSDIRDYGLFAKPRSGDAEYDNYPESYIYTFKNDYATENLPVIGSAIKMNMCGNRTWYQERLADPITTWKYFEAQGEFRNGAFMHDKNLSITGNVQAIITYDAQNVALVLNNVTIVGGDATFNDTNGYRVNQYTMTLQRQVTIDNTTTTSPDPEWMSWVVGINDYRTAKHIWDTAHDAFLTTGVIQKAPTNRTDLKWAVDRNWFYGTEAIHSTAINQDYIMHFYSNDGLGYVVGGNVRCGTYDYSDVLYKMGDRIRFYSSDTPEDWVEMTYTSRTDYITYWTVNATNFTGDVPTYAYNSNLNLGYIGEEVEASYDSSVEYGVDYFKKLIDWSTYQKYQVNYSLPLTEETVKYELLDDIQFSDPIITPESGEFGVGWITKYEVVPSKDLVNVQITFEPSFLRRPLFYKSNCVDIHENDDVTTIDITETGNANDINITEPCSDY